MIPKEIYRKLPYAIRRRLNQRQSFRLIVCLALLGFVLLLFQMYFIFWIQDVSKEKSHSEQARQVQPDRTDGKRGETQELPKDLVKDITGPGSETEQRRFPKKIVPNLPGVPSARMHHYVPDKENYFKCILTQRHVPFAWVNDDYCDCEDGSDEPSTGACPTTKFYCGNMVVPASRVNDGICDCCDGSDEWLGHVLEGGLPLEEQKKIRRYQTPCPNTC